MIKAQIVADSVSEQGIRLTTMYVSYPKFIHGEMMTHRDFSRNASSSRAVPFKKLLAECMFDDLRAYPVVWGAEQKGMSPGDQIDHPTLATHTWMEAALSAAKHASTLHALGVHKSICNRIIEPFTHIRVLISSTRWANFFALRLDGNADPTMRALAVVMYDAYMAGKPKLLKAGQWHLPYVDDTALDTYVEASGHHPGHKVIDLRIKISVARCARTSYLSNDTGKRSTIEEDLALYDRLVGSAPLHASPAEHQATPSDDTEKEPALKEVLDLVHFNKILRADAIVVVGPDYIGFSTAREILWANMQGETDPSTDEFYGRRKY